MFQSPSPHLSAGRGFRKEGEGKQNKQVKGRELKVFYIQASTVHFDKDLENGQLMDGLVYVVLVLRLNVTNSPRTEKTEVLGLYLMKLVPRIVIQTCYFSTSYILEGAFTEAVSKELWGGLQIPTVTI